MSISCECPDCGKRYRVSDTRAGQMVPCKECGGDVFVRNVSRRSQSRDYFDDDDDDDETEANTSNAMTIAFVVGAVIAVAGLISVAVDDKPGNANRPEGLRFARQEPERVVPPLANEVRQQPAHRPRQKTAGELMSEFHQRRIAEAKARRPVQPIPSPITVAPSANAPAPRPSLPAADSSRMRVATIPSKQAQAGTGGFGSADGGEEADDEPQTAIDEDRTTIPFSDRDGFTCGPQGCPVVVSANRVWNIAEMSVVAKLDGAYQGRSSRALSPDGSWFAAMTATENRNEASITVWDTRTGQTQFAVPGDPNNAVDVVLLSNEKLFIGDRRFSELQVWDLAAKAHETSLDIENASFKKGSTAITLDGKYLATVARNKLVVVRTATGEIAAVMENPTPVTGFEGHAIVVKNNKIVADSRSGLGDTAIVYAWLQSLHFSPDSEELAGVSTHPVPRLLCWSNRGKLVCDLPLKTESRAFWENTLQWFPSRRAWLIENDIFDRETGKVVLSIRERFAQKLAMHVLDDDRLLVSFPHEPAHAQVYDIPWEEIRKSLAQIKNRDDALLSPARPVSILLNDGTAGAKGSVGGLVTQAFAARLGRDGIEVAPGQTTFFRLRFAESSGDRLPIFERQSPFDFRGRDTGKTAVEAKGSLVAELIVPGADEPIWRQTLDVESSRSFDEEVTDEKLRESMIQKMNQRIEELALPYFVPISQDDLALPIVIK